MTPRLSRERLPELQGQHPRFFANWLRNGILSFLSGGQRDAFPGAANFVGWAGAIEEDLAAIFGVLNPTEQSSLQEGVAIALAEMPLETPCSGNALIALIRLAGLVSAREAVDGIVAVLVAAERAGVDHIDEAYCCAFDLVVELASPAPRAVRALHTLLTSDGFRDDLAAPALIALARTDPDNFASHLDVLAHPLNAQYHPHYLDVGGGRTTHDRDRLLEVIAALVPTASLADAFGAARRVAFGSDWAVHDWFARGVLTSDASEIVTLRKKVQEWIYVTAIETDEASEETLTEDGHGEMDEFTPALGRLLAMAGDDDW